MIIYTFINHIFLSDKVKVIRFTPCIDFIGSLTPVIVLCGIRALFNCDQVVLIKVIEPIALKLKLRSIFKTKRIWIEKSDVWGNELYHVFVCALF